ncbi:hypothetical protein GGR54DRAFT_559387 [Hypoxylon sp. NC1633]|nr:hypothetical protein GGR54DRAFT_559387 [Hypoxylon sp. NC1633]
MSPPPPPQPLHSSLHQISTPSQHYQRQKPQQPQQPRQNNQRPHHQQSSLSSSNLLRGLQIVSPSNIPKGTDNDKNTHFHYNRGPSGVDGHRNNNDDSFGEDVGIITESGSGTSSSDDRLAGYRLKFEATPQADDEKAEEKEHKIKTSYTNAIDATIATALTQTAANQSQSTNICRPHFNPHLPSPTPPIYYQTLDQYPPNLPPPRSSSLLPPPRNAETNILSPVHAADPLANKTPTTSSRRHSRSSSLGAVSDGFRNLNR